MPRWNGRRDRAAMGLLLAAALAACGGSDRPPADGSRPDPLAGVWDAELVLTRPMLGRADSAHAGSVRGRIALLHEDGLRGAPGLTGTPTHVGTHTLTLRRFGFEPRRQDGAPGIVARWVRPDSLELAFESPGGDETFTMRGQLAGDSIVGQWHYSTRVTGAAGRVTMHRAGSLHPAGGRSKPERVPHSLDPPW